MIRHTSAIMICVTLLQNIHLKRNSTNPWRVIYATLYIGVVFFRQLSMTKFVLQDQINRPKVRIMKVRIVILQSFRSFRGIADLQ